MSMEFDEGIPRAPVSLTAHGALRTVREKDKQRSLHDSIISYHLDPRGPLPVRQRVLTVPKRLRDFLQRDAALQGTVLQGTVLQGTVLRIFLAVVERCLRDHSPACPAAARIGRSHSSTVSA